MQYNLIQDKSTNKNQLHTTSMQMYLSLLPVFFCILFEYDCLFVFFNFTGKY